MNYLDDFKGNIVKESVDSNKLDNGEVVCPPDFIPYEKKATINVVEINSARSR